jgi:tetratricopeptide (TPR) repeat protein
MSAPSWPTATPVDVPPRAAAPPCPHLPAGDAALWAGDLAAAEAAYRRCEPPQASAHARRAYLLALQPARCRASLAQVQAARERGDDAETLAFVALALAEHGHYAECFDAARQAVARPTAPAIAHLALARAHLVRGEATAALAQLDGALAQAPEHPLAHALQAQALLQRPTSRAIDPALRAAERGVALAPNFAPARLALAEAHVAAWEYHEAHQALTALVRQRPDDLAARLALARLLAAEGAPHKARVLLDAAQDAAPEAPAVHVARGWHLLAQGDAAAARDAFDRALHRDPDHARAYAGLGLARYELGGCTGAVVALHQALAQMPNAAHVHLGMAHSLACLGKASEAQAHIEQAQALASPAPDVLLALAAHHARSDAPLTARDLYHAALAQRPDDARIYVALGRQDLRDPARRDVAADNFRYALTQAPDDPATTSAALVGLGTVLNAQGRHEQAAALFRDALNHGDDASAEYGLGVALTMLGQPSAAIPHLEAALDHGGAPPEAHVYLSRAHRQLKQYPEAGEALHRFLWHRADVPTAYLLRQTAQSLVDKQYWIPEADVLTALNDAFGLVNAQPQGDLPLALVAAEIAPRYRQRTLHVTVQLGVQPADAGTLYRGLATALACSAAVAPRILPPLDRGVTVEVHDLRGVPLATAHVPPQTAQDLADGLIRDHATLMQQAALQDPRPTAQETGIASIPEAAIPSADATPCTASLSVRNLLAPGGDGTSATAQAGDPAQRACSTGGPYTAQAGDVYAHLEADDVYHPQDHLTRRYWESYARQTQGSRPSAPRDDDADLARQLVAEGRAMHAARTSLEQQAPHLARIVQVKWQAWTQAPLAAPAADPRPHAGLAFVRTLAQMHLGPDDTLASSPASTEQVLHPQMHQAHDADPRPVALPALPAQMAQGWRVAGAGVMGEYRTRAYLDDRLAADLASLAAAGWGGDRYVILEREADAGHLLLWKTVWDSEEDAREFVLAHRLAFHGASGYRETHRDLHGGERTLRWEHAVGHLYLRQQGATVWLISATHAEDLDALLPHCDISVN